MHEAVAAIAACGVSPIVRIAANEGWMVKRALDSGGAVHKNRAQLLCRSIPIDKGCSSWHHCTPFVYGRRRQEARSISKVPARGYKGFWLSFSNGEIWGPKHDRGVILFLCKNIFALDRRKADSEILAVPTAG